MKKFFTALSFLLLLPFAATGCDLQSGADASNPSNPSSASNSSNDPKLVVEVSSENKTLQPIINQFNKQNHVDVEAVYKGSVDMMNDLQNNPSSYDAIWASNSIWINMGDTHHKVKDTQSIMTSPVVFGIKKSLAKQLGYIGKPVSVKQILADVEAGNLQFMMTSATQSNSGATAYIGFLYALLNDPQTITSSDLQKPELRSQIKSLLAGINRSSGSSGWLKDLFLKGNYEAMVNYESVIIETNQELIKQGKEPLYVVYPSDGLTIADYPLGYIDNGNSTKEALFKKFQDYMLSSSVQKQISETGRRTGFGGVATNVDPQVFNADWGINVKKTLSTIQYPSRDVLLSALNFYQTDFRKPSYTIYCVDFSGSMGENGGQDGVKKAMSMILSPTESSKYMLEPSQNDVTEVIPFNDSVIADWKANPSKYSNLLNDVDNLEADGGTDIYSPVIKALDSINSQNLSSYNVSVVLMTDGQSNTGASFQDLQNEVQKINKDIPVYAIMFGDADQNQLGQITNLTRAQLFDGKGDLVKAFKDVRGYN